MWLKVFKYKFFSFLPQSLSSLILVFFHLLLITFLNKKIFFIINTNFTFHLYVLQCLYVLQDLYVFNILECKCQYSVMTYFLKCSYIDMHL